MVGERDAPVLECADHGESPWEGHIVCQACGRFWRPPWAQLGLGPEQALLPDKVPFCDCTAVLLPPPGTPFATGGGPHYEAVAVCVGCYEEHKPRSPKYGDGPDLVAPVGELH